MQNTDKSFPSGRIEMSCFPEFETEAEPLVVFELVVPVAAKVPVPRQHAEVAKLVVRQASVTSTVPGKVLTQLRANNTAHGAGWCITVSLAGSPPPRLSSLY